MSRCWCFGGVVFDEGSLKLVAGGRITELERKPLEVLLHLLRNAGKVVTKDDLIKAVWPGRVISDSALTSTIAKLREALGDEGEAIKTVHAHSRTSRRRSSCIASLPMKSVGLPELRLRAWLG